MTRMGNPAVNFEVSGQPAEAEMANPVAQPSYLAPILDAMLGGQTIDLATLIVNEDGIIELLSESRSTGFCFELSGIPIRVGMHSDGQSIRISISGDLGFLPFSIESRDRRNAINAVIAATAELKYSKLEVVDNKHILLRGSKRMARPFQLTDMFMALCELVHEVQPFVDLLGDCMDHAQTDIPVPGQCQSMNPRKPLATILAQSRRRVDMPLYAKQLEPARYAVAAE